MAMKAAAIIFGVMTLLPALALAQPLPPPIGGPAGGEAVYVATTAGPTPLTGSTSETNLAALKIPANTMGKNGVAEVYALWSFPASANNKTMTMRYNNTSGSTAGGVTGAPSISASTNQSAQLIWIIRNNNATNSQSIFAPGGSTPFALYNGVLTALAIDTTQDSFINLNGTLALGTETLTLQHAYVVVYPHQ
jgi:hypothetical protein